MANELEIFEFLEADNESNPRLSLWTLFYTLMHKLKGGGRTAEVEIGRSCEECVPSVSSDFVSRA